MKFDEYILEELSFHKWKLKSGFEFKKNKVVKVKVKDGIIDRKIYTSGYFSHSICKYELTDKSAQADFKEKVGVGDPFSVNKASSPIATL